MNPSSTLDHQWLANLSDPLRGVFRDISKPILGRCWITSCHEKYQGPLLSIESWLFNRYPCNGLLCSPKTTRDFVHCSSSRPSCKPKHCNLAFQTSQLLLQLRGLKFLFCAPSVRTSIANPTVLEANGSKVRLQTIKRFTESAKTCTFRKFQVTSKFEKSTFFLPNTHLKRKSKRSHELVGISEFPQVLSVGYSSPIIKVSIIKSTIN